MGVGGPCDYCDSLSPKIRIWDFGLLFWNQTLDSGLQASDLGLWTQYCQYYEPDAKILTQTKLINTKNSRLVNLKHVLNLNNIFNKILYAEPQIKTKKNAFSY